MKKVLIIEDEERNANKLARLLSDIDPTISILNVIESVKSAVQWFNENEQTPDLIMMDIRLEDGLCFEIFEQIEVTAPVIFTTSYDEYALKAFKVNSVDYLMKPIREDELRQALDKLKQRQSPVDLSDTINDILGHLHKKDTVYRSRFLLPYKDGFKSVKVEEIDHVYSEFKTTYLFLKDGTTCVVSQTMEELEEELDSSLFFRANRQHIVHVDAIENIHNYFNGKLKVTLKLAPEREIIISREKAPVFKQWLNY